MGCFPCGHTFRRKKKTNIPEVSIFVPLVPNPVHTDFHALRGLIPNDLILKLSSLRNRIVLLAEKTDRSINALQQALEEYLPVLVGLTKKEYGFENMVEFKWKNSDDPTQEICIANSWFELLSVIHMMAVLTLVEGNSLLISKLACNSPQRIAFADNRREVVGLLLKASGLLEYCVRDILVHIPKDIKKKLPKDLQEGTLEAVSFQALGQGTELQLGLAVENQKASLPVKRRMACEQLSYFGQAHSCLSACDNSCGYGKKNMLFIKWKYLESKAAAYYYHGLVLDNGTEPSCHVSAICCFLAAEELMVNSKKACLSFCLAAPVTRIPPITGAMKHLYQKIPDIALRKTQMYNYLLEEEKILQTLPDLPEFQLSLIPEDYELPEIYLAWDNEQWKISGNVLKDCPKES